MESINAGGEIERETWKQSKGLDVQMQQKAAWGGRGQPTAQSRSDVLGQYGIRQSFIQLLVPYCMNLGKLLHLGLSDTRKNLRRKQTLQKALNSKHDTFLGFSLLIILMQADDNKSDIILGRILQGNKMTVFKCIAPLTVWLLIPRDGIRSGFHPECQGC